MPKKDDPNTRILLIGPLPNTIQSATNIIGGTKIMTANAVRQLGMRAFDLNIINTSRPRTNLSFWKSWCYELFTFLRVIRGLFKAIGNAELVFLTLSPYSALLGASTIWYICKVARRPLVLLFYGGYWSQIYQGYSPITRWLTDRTYLRSEIIYVEAKQLIREFGSPHNFRWHPNTRDLTVPNVVRRDKVRQLVFIAQLRMEKGLAEALEACRYLPDGCHLQVFGPRMPNTDFSLFKNHPKATYGGVLEPSEIAGVLCEHDLLLLPTYYKGECYPGIILEAFQCGLPVITTRWQFIPEVVQHEENGLLVEPRSVMELKAAIERLLADPSLYRRLCKGAKRQGEFFRSTVWYDKLAADLHDLAQTEKIVQG